MIFILSYFFFFPASIAICRRRCYDYCFCCCRSCWYPYYHSSNCSAVATL